VIRGRIGNGKTVHWIEPFDPAVMWGVSLCQKWAGKVWIASHLQVYCRECRERRKKLEVQDRPDS